MKCFEVTLKGFDAGWAAEAQVDDLGDAADRLVKWVQAPSREALDKFLASHDLGGGLDEIPGEMDQFYAEQDHEGGIDLILDDAGGIASASREDWRAEWAKEVRDVETILAGVGK